jgi:glycosyltransferase involved in cell wall biosynthesis
MLTIGIPTFNRPQFLPKALRSALNQTIPVKVIVTDNGDSGPTREILASDEFKDAGIRYITTDATSAWPNWRAAAASCDTEYFAWLQDDDVVRDTYAERIVDVMEYFPDANVWMARLSCAFSSTLGMPYKGNCPWIPMDMLDGNPSRWMGGAILAASSYLTSWSLSPALAFRTGPLFDRALDEMPENCDVFIERLMPARMAYDSPIVGDPIIAGYWVQHTRMLHLQMNADESGCAAQLDTFLATLDRIMDDVSEDWESMLRRWRGWIPLDILNGWIENAKKMPASVNRGRYLERVVALLSEPFENARSIAAAAKDQAA